jgi:hypothetical protein
MWRLDYRAEKGDPRAQVALSVFRERGVVLERDRALACASGDARKPEAARWYTLAAGEGFAPAQYNTGRLHVIGLGVEENIPQALTLAEDGDVAQAGEMLAWLSARESINGDASAQRASASLPGGDDMAAPGDTAPRDAR